MVTYQEKNCWEKWILRKKWKNPIGSEKVDLWENYLKQWDKNWNQDMKRRENENKESLENDFFKKMKIFLYCVGNTIFRDDEKTKRLVLKTWKLGYATQTKVRKQLQDVEKTKKKNWNFLDEYWWVETPYDWGNSRKSCLTQN